jgi:tRNA (adenine-N(1)-)-methyltransferase non-catalytic subunit
MSTPHTVADGGWVVLLLSGGERKLQRVRSGARLHIGKHSALYDPIIGAPFGASFVLETGDKEARLVRDPRTLEQINSSLTDAAAALGGASADANNAELRDDGAASTAQGLDHDAILRLKSEGTSGEALVLAIAAGSKTFAGKTAFSQEKYLRKKARKHLLHATVLEVTALSLVDLFMIKSPEKLLGLRRDTLGMMLALSNAQPGSRALVLDGTHSILSAAMAQRMGGSGALLSVYVNKPSLDGFQWLSQGAGEHTPVGSASLAQLLQWKTQQARHQPAGGDAAATASHASALGGVAEGAMGSGAGSGAGGTGSVAAEGAADAPADEFTETSVDMSMDMPVDSSVDASGDVSVDASGDVSGDVSVDISLDAGRLPSRAEAAASSATGAGASADGLGGECVKSPSGKAVNRHNGQARVEAGQAAGEAAAGEGGRRSKPTKVTNEALSNWLSPGFTSFAIAVRESPAPVLEHLLELLLPGSPFAIYSQTIEPLAQCLHLCQRRRAAVRLQLLESFTRSYQVALNRTHPNMNTYPATGYVLSGVKVAPPGQAPSPAAQ